VTSRAGTDLVMSKAGRRGQPGSRTHGPMIILEEGCTTVLPPRFPLEIDRFGNMRISIPAAQRQVDEEQRRVLSWQSEMA